MGFVVVDDAMPYLKPIIDAKFLTMGFFGISIVKILAFVLGGIIGFIIGYIISSYVLNIGLLISKNLERLLTRVPSQELLSGTVGLLFGLIIANLIGFAFSSVPYVGPYIPIVLSAIFGYLGMRLMGRKGPELYQNLHFLNRDKKKPEAVSEENKAEMRIQDNTKLLDTSVIIDGRISELCKTGFLEGKLVAPLFVLEELQRISDSADALKRNRGRRGLDLLQEMQQDEAIDIMVVDNDYEDISEVDSKLMRLALEKGWKLLTNDFNLNKVASLQGIKVLNLNDLANALKPALIPGEWLRVQVIKEGKENNQGVAYLDDGTMIVIESGAQYVDTTIDVMVTSVLQTSAGRMIFAKAEGSKEN